MKIKFIKDRAFILYMGDDGLVKKFKTLGEPSIEYSIEDLYGNYVAIPSFKEKGVIAFGPNRMDVYKEAIKKGYDDPIVMKYFDPAMPFAFTSHPMRDNIERKVA